MADDRGIDPKVTNRENELRRAEIDTDYAALGEKLTRRGVDIDEITRAVGAFEVALPSWGVGTGGTRFARFPIPGEPRHVFEKVEDCAVVHELTRTTPRISLHFPWDEPDDPRALVEYATRLGLSFDAVNSNTFQDQEGQAQSYKFGSLTHVDRAVRDQAVEHNLECIELGQALGSQALTVWIADGWNFPGQQDFQGALSRYLESTARIYAALPDDWRMLIEHKLFEPAFYATVIADWGTSYLCAAKLGPKAQCLVDLGHHAPNTNIEMIVARLAQFGKLGGFHFNDSKYGDDDLDAGSINPFQLFLVFNELIIAARQKLLGFDPAHMIDQSHNVTDPIESLMATAGSLRRAYAQALLVDREALEGHQRDNDALMAARSLRAAAETDVEPILAMARLRAGGAIDPITTYRASGYRRAKAESRPQKARGGTGIV
jgi:L-rhamnose isomerase/sugar isomerase